MALNHSCMDFQEFAGWLSFEFGLDFVAKNSDPSSVDCMCADNVIDRLLSSSKWLQNRDIFLFFKFSFKQRE